MNSWPVILLENMPIAVMPTVLLGGPLALLALLFPAACGGLMLFLKRWRILLSVLSLSSTFYLLHSWFCSYLFDSWWESQLQLWFGMAFIAGVGLFFQRRNSRSKETGEVLPATAGDLVILGLATLFCAAGIIWGLLSRASMFAAYMQPMIVMAMATIGGAWHAFRQRSLQKAGISRRSWETQSVILLISVFATTSVLGKIGLQAATANSFRQRWSFIPPEAGAIYSSPVVAGDQVFAAAALRQGSDESGALYGLNRDTGELLWTFTDDGRMKPVLSSPCYADERIYIGEGFHTDAPCKLYCISATSGKKLWDFETTSHTESTPTVVDDRVYFGAGDDGLYCLDAQTGKMIWHFEGPHVDGRPAVKNGRVYAGSGYGNLEVLCLDSANGKVIWRVPVDLPSFAAATVSEGNVFFGIGNGNFVGSAMHPAGALLCVDADSGNIKWQHNVGDAVHSQPLVIGNQIAFVSRDRHCYCLQISSGKLQWKRDLGAPALAAPVLASVPGSGGDSGLYVLASDGFLSCLNTSTGVPYSITQAGGGSPVKSSFIATPSVAFTSSAPGGRIQLHVAGSMQQLTAKPVLLCFE